MQMQAITGACKSTVEAIRAKHRHTAASHAFASLYVWREDMGLSLYQEEDLFAVKCSWRGENTWFYPCGSKEKISRFIAARLKEPNLTLCYAREEDTDFLRQFFPGQLQIEERPGDHEYLYSRAEQQALRGKKFCALRNHIHRVEAEHNMEWETLCDQNIGAALEISREWQRRSDSPDGLTEQAASETLLKEWTRLGVQGVVISVDGEPYAVAAGYPLSADTFDLSLAKQKTCLSGLSVYTKHILISSLPEQYTIINAEEDLNIAGLRTMKLQMRPAGQIKMYEGRAKTGG